MTKKNRAAAIAEDAGIKKTRVKEIVQQVFEFIIGTLV